MEKKHFVHPYIPNSAPEPLKEMLDFLGMESAEDIYKEIPDHLRFHGELDLPPAILSEQKLEKHVREILDKNKNCLDYTSYLGGGCWQHYVPEVCTTIMGRDEFLTAYVGEAYSDHGKFQALFETASMIGDLTGFEAVGTPNYDWANAAAIACRMAVRSTARNGILLAKNIGKERRLIIENYVKPENKVQYIDYDPETGLMDLEDLKAKLDDSIACLYYENPTYLGNLEDEPQKISDLVHEAGGRVIVGVDPTSLGILEGPAMYGADYAVGDYQPLGLNMSYGGNQGGFVATKDDKDYIGESPSLLYGICETVKEGEIGFGEVFYERTAYASREKGKDFIGTTSALVGVVAGVYMALMGPQGFRELGEGIVRRVAYTKKLLEDIDGVKLRFAGPSYCDFTVDFNDTGKTVADINKKLLDYKIFGGYDLSRDFPELGQCALYSVTEMRDMDDLHALQKALKEVLA